MTSKDWDKEMAKIDSQLKSITDEELAKASTRHAVATQAGKGMTAPAKLTRGTAVYARVFLAAALGVGMYFWPYAARCGPGLFGYLGAVTVLTTAGIWTSVWTWRHRAARAHVLSLVIVVWGLVLAAIEVLPRVGYAIPDMRHPATWVCE